jgi:hypothetical protein
MLNPVRHVGCVQLLALKFRTAVTLQAKIDDRGKVNFVNQLWQITIQLFVSMPTVSWFLLRLKGHVGIIQLVIFDSVWHVIITVCSWGNRTAAGEVTIPAVCSLFGG